MKRNGHKNAIPVSVLIATKMSDMLPIKACSSEDEALQILIHRHLSDIAMCVMRLPLRDIDAILAEEKQRIFLRLPTFIRKMPFWQRQARMAALHSILLSTAVAVYDSRKDAYPIFTFPFARTFSQTKRFA